MVLLLRLWSRTCPVVLILGYNTITSTPRLQGAKWVNAVPLALQLLSALHPTAALTATNRIALHRLIYILHEPIHTNHAQPSFIHLFGAKQVRWPRVLDEEVRRVDVVKFLQIKPLHLHLLMLSKYISFSTPRLKTVVVALIPTIYRIWDFSTDCNRVLKKKKKQVQTWYLWQ